jgi:prepilin peptidase CpaA
MLMHLQQWLSMLSREFALGAVSEKIWALTLAFTVYAAFTDWRTRRIPNWLTVSGFFAGIAVNAIFAGWQGAKGSLEGAGLALGLLLPFVLLRGLGAGDWKLMGAVGALMGWRPMLLVMLASVMASGFMAVVQMIATRRVKRTLWNTLVLAKGLATFGFSMNREISLDNPTLMKVPFGVGVGAATVFCFVLAHWLV